MLVLNSVSMLLSFESMQIGRGSNKLWPYGAGRVKVQRGSVAGCANVGCAIEKICVRLFGARCMERTDNFSEAVHTKCLVRAAL